MSAPTSTQSQKVPSCAYTQQTLHGLLKQADKKEVKFDRYFFVNNAYATRDDVPLHFRPRAALLPSTVRCIKCGCTISEHAASSPPIQLPHAEPAYRLVDSWGSDQSSTQVESSMLEILRKAQPPGSPYLQCIVLKQLFPKCFYARESVVGANIIPQRARRWFRLLQTGPLHAWTIEDINSTKNVLPMVKFLEIAFDNLVWCFVPGSELGKWLIRVFVPDLGAPVPICDSTGTECVFYKSCTLVQKDRVTAPGKILNNSPLTYADLNGKEVVLPDALSVSAIMHHAEMTFKRHEADSDFSALIPQYVAQSRWKGHRPNIDEWLLGVTTSNEALPARETLHPAPLEVQKEATAVSRNVPVGGALKHKKKI